jgi:hypothetical protein
MENIYHCDECNINICYECLKSEHNSHKSYNLKQEFNEIYTNTILPKIYKIREIIDDKSKKNAEHIKKIEEVYEP